MGFARALRFKLQTVFSKTARDSLRVSHQSISRLPGPGWKRRETCTAAPAHWLHQAAPWDQQELQSLSRWQGGLKTGWMTRPVVGKWLVVYPRGRYRGQYCITSSLVTWMMAKCVPSASSQKIWNQEECLVRPRGVVAFRGTCTGSRNGLTGTSRRLRRQVLPYFVFN